MEIISQENSIISNIVTIYEWNYENMIYNTLNKFVYSNWKIIHLTANETRLLEIFIKNKWILINKSNLINSVWWEYDISRVSDNTINVTIAKLRRKLWKNFKLRTFVNKWYILDK